MRSDTPPCIAWRVSLTGSRDEIQLEVDDDGVGFDPERTTGRQGLGLIGMRERLSLVDGECFIESQPGAGTRIRARVPLRRSDRLPFTSSPATSSLRARDY